MLDRLRREDDGFSLVETLAAMIVFAILAVSVGGVVLHMFDLTKSNASRVVAANLAAEQIEATRARRALDVPDGAAPVVSRVVNGVSYRIAQNANLVAAQSGTSLCTGDSMSSNAELAYKLVTVTVEWDDMGPVKPVRQDTLLSMGLGFSGADPAKGTGAVAVTGSDGAPRSGVTVTLTPSGAQRTTGVDGCAVFPGLTPATSYTASAGQDGWAGRSGARTAVSASFSVTAKGVTRIPLEYERVGALAMSLTGPAGLQPPAALGMTLSSGNFTTGSRPFSDCSVVVGTPYGCVSGAPRAANALYPGQYTAKAGTCTDGLGSAGQLAEVQVGATSTVSLPLAGVRVEVRTAPTLEFPAGAPASGYTVHALHAGDGVCVSQSWPMTPAGSSSQSLALPAGTWTFSLTPNGALLTGAPWPTRTLVVGEAVPTVVVTAP